MAQEETVQSPMITFKGQEYLISELGPDTRRYVDHLVDLGKKLYQTELDLQQYQYIEQQFNVLLEQSLLRDSAPGDIEEEEV